MVLEQEHKEKWASKQEQRFKEEHRKTQFRKKMRIPTLIRNYSDSLRRTHASNLRPSRQIPPRGSFSPEETIEDSSPQ